MLKTINNIRNDKFKTVMKINYDINNWLDMIYSLDKPINIEIIKEIKKFGEKIFNKINYYNIGKYLVVYISNNNYEYSQYENNDIIYQIFTIHSKNNSKETNKMKKYSKKSKEYSNDNYIHGIYELLKKEQEFHKINKNINININIQYSCVIIKKISLKNKLGDFYYIYIDFYGEEENYIEFIINDVNIIDKCIDKYSDYEYVKKINKENINEIETCYYYVNIHIHEQHNIITKCQSVIKIINYDNKRVFESYVDNIMDTGPYNLHIDSYDITNEIINNYETCYVSDYFDINDLIKKFIYNDKLFENNIVINKIPEMYDELKNIGINLPIELKEKNEKVYNQFSKSGINNIKLIENMNNDLIIKQYNCEGELTNNYILKKTIVGKDAINNSIDNAIEKANNGIKYTIKIDMKNKNEITEKKNEIIKKINEIIKNDIETDKRNIDIMEKNNESNKKIMEKKDDLYIDLELELHNYESYEKKICYDKDIKSEVITYYGKESNIERIIITEEKGNGERNIYTYYISPNNQIKNSTKINNKQKILIINNKDTDFMVGYKLTVDKDNNYCVVELGIHSDSLVVPDTYYNKFRTNKCKVLNIGKIYNDDKKNYYYSYSYNSECPICYETESLVQIRECQHKICKICCDKLEKRKCPLCNKEIDGYLINENIKEAYSFVYNDFKYVIGETIIIEDFEYGKKICGKGIHYNDKVEDIFIWKEYNEIPEELKL